MTEHVKRRPYRMANRARQARETRRRVVDAAAELFIRRGYSETTVPAIAELASVAVPTVYSSIGSKADLLRAVVEQTIRGDDDDAPLGTRPRWREILEEADAERKLAAFARFHREICDREAMVFAQVEAAAGADANAAELLREHDSGRYEMQQRFAKTLAQRKSLRRGLNADAAADIIWTLASERTYLALVRDRGWTPDAYESWLRDQLVASLLRSSRQS